MIVLLLADARFHRGDGVEDQLVYFFVKRAVACAIAGVDRAHRGLCPFLDGVGVQHFSQGVGEDLLFLRCS